MVVGYKFPIETPHIPRSYKLLVPKVSVALRPPLSPEELTRLQRRLDAHGLVRLPNDVERYMIEREMRNEIEDWRWKL